MPRKELLGELYHCHRRVNEAALRLCSRSISNTRPFAAYFRAEHFLRGPGPAPIPPICCPPC